MKAAAVGASVVGEDDHGLLGSGGTHVWKLVGIDSELTIVDRDLLVECGYLGIARELASSVVFRWAR